jgi:hypothetical protein
METRSAPARASEPAVARDQADAAVLVRPGEAGRHVVDLRADRHPEPRTPFVLAEVEFDGPAVRLAVELAELHIDLVHAPTLAAHLPQLSVATSITKRYRTSEASTRS